MSASDISAIPTVNNINNAQYRKFYAQIIRGLPRLVQILNAPSNVLTDEEKIQKLTRMREYLDRNMQIILVALGAPDETTEEVMQPIE